MKKKYPIFCRGKNLGTRRVDFFVHGRIMVEIKAVIRLEDVHLVQAKKYLEAYNMEIGLMINFGAKSLEFKRTYNDNLRTSEKNSVNP